MTDGRFVLPSPRIQSTLHPLFWLCLFYWSSPLAANSDSPLWQNLLLANQSHHVSEENREFYLGQGLVSPTTEMRKLLSGSVDQMTCRFPARMLYLERIGQLSEPLDVSNCGKLQEFMSVMKSDSLELVFAGPSVSSPMSYFGHIFLKFKKNDDTYFSRTLAFLAPLDDADSMLAITAAGAVSNIAGQYHIAPYHQIISQYIEMEQRPIHSYELAIEPENKKLLLYHVFELAALDRPYNFFWGNCATRIQELLAIAFPATLGRTEFGITSPQNVIERLRERDLIAHEEKIPARSEALFSAYHDLPGPQQAALKDFLRSQDKEGWIQGNNNTIVPLAQALYRRQFIAVGRPPPDYQALMGIKAKPLSPPYALPNRSKLPRMFSLGWENHDEPKTTLRFRPGLFDRNLESLSLATESSFRYLDTTISISDTTTSLERLDLIGLSAAKKRSVVGRPLSWTFETGLNREFDDSSLNYHLGVGVGMSWGGKNYLVSVIPTLAYFTGEGAFPSIDMNASLRLGLARFDAEIRHFGSNGRDRPKNRRYLAVNYHLSPEWVVRSGFDEVTQGIDIAISYYF